MGYFRSMRALYLRMGKRPLDALAQPIPSDKGASRPGRGALAETGRCRTHGQALAAAVSAE